MKCHNCKRFDSLIRQINVDKNGNIVMAGEVTAFNILHPEEKGKIYKEVLLCGMCYENLDRQKDKLKVDKKSSKATMKKAQNKDKSKNYYVCPFCKTANEPLRNTCKTCERILFSTEYETKRISSKEFTNRFKPYYSKKIVISLLILLAIGVAIGLHLGNGKPQHATLFEKDNGPSMYEWSDGTKYIGDFKDGEPHGKGTIEWPNGEKYVGDFRYGEITGYGTLEKSDGSQYTGNLLNGKPHGYGTMNYANGSVYKGDWVNGEQE